MVVNFFFMWLICFTLKLSIVQSAEKEVVATKDSTGFAEHAKLVHALLNNQKKIETQESSEVLENLELDLLTLAKSKYDSATNRVLDDLMKLVDVQKKETEKSDDKVQDDDCFDEVSYCSTMKPFCNTHKEELVQKCRKTCNFCRCRFNVWKTSTCKRFETHGYCSVDSYKEKLKWFCHKTCGHCRAHSPPACQIHPKGCCWDKVSFVSKGCPVCEDNFSVGKICKTFKDVCNNTGKPGKFMKKNCPVSCGLCDPQTECMNYHEGHPCQTYKQIESCKDTTGDDRCRVWKQSNVCGMFKDLAEKWCFKTCFNCHHVHEGEHYHHGEKHSNEDHEERSHV